MTEAKMRVEAMAGLAAPPFHPILTDAGAGPTFTMLGTTMRLIATAAGTGGRYTVIEQVTPPAWRPRPAVWYSLSLPADWRNTSWRWQNVRQPPIPHSWLNWLDRSV